MINGFHDEIDERTEQKKNDPNGGKPRENKMWFKGGTHKLVLCCGKEKNSNSINKKTIDNEVGGIRVGVGGEEIFRNNKKK
jgi:hypothetical protein